MFPGVVRPWDQEELNNIAGKRDVWITLFAPLPL